jgi:hypothetical protein
VWTEPNNEDRSKGHSEAGAAKWLVVTLVTNIPINKTTTTTNLRFNHHSGAAIFYGYVVGRLVASVPAKVSKLSITGLVSPDLAGRTTYRIEVSQRVLGGAGADGGRKLATGPGSQLRSRVPSSHPSPFRLPLRGSEATSVLATWAWSSSAVAGLGVPPPPPL